MATNIPNGMMAFGQFIFMLRTAPYQELKHTHGWRHPTNSRVGLRPARQYIGPDDETVTLSGTLYPELTGGRVSLDQLKAMADQGQPAALIQGDGTVYGHFVITGLEETYTLFFADGAARKIDFSLSLARVDDGRNSDWRIIPGNTARTDQAQSSTYQVKEGQAEFIGPPRPDPGWQIIPGGTKPA
jgi:phage protein U